MRIHKSPSMSAVQALLQANNLPIADLSALQAHDFLYCGTADNPTGIIGLQIVDNVGLLRSLVVSQTVRNQGCGTALVMSLETKAKQDGVEDLYLLTETAEPFFVNLNYTTIPRASAPMAIRQTQEFSGLCPDDAILMQKKLVDGD